MTGASTPQFKLSAISGITPVLWSGRLAGVADTHSDKPLAQGFLPFWPARGTCEIRGSAANLWYAAAKALGFEVTMLRYPDPLFVAHLTGFCLGTKSLNPPQGRLRRPRQLPDVVFLDFVGLPLGPKYWDA